jgi:hypothetical protein
MGRGLDDHFDAHPLKIGFEEIETLHRTLLLSSVDYQQLAVCSRLFVSQLRLFKLARSWEGHLGRSQPLRCFGL